MASIRAISIRPREWLHAINLTQPSKTISRHPGVIEPGRTEKERDFRPLPTNLNQSGFPFWELMTPTIPWSRSIAANSSSVKEFFGRVKNFTLRYGYFAMVRLQRLIRNWNIKKTFIFHIFNSNGQSHLQNQKSIKSLIYLF